MLNSCYDKDQDLLMQSNKPTSRLRWTDGLWWLMTIILLAWTLWQFWPRSRPQVDLPYSAFVSQVQTGNVASVQIAGADITGTFAKPYTATNDTSKTSQTYTAFQTRFPDVVGDTTLLPLLESHQVAVQVAPAATNVLLDLLVNGLPVLLLAGVILWSVSQSARQQSGVFSFGRNRARVYMFDRPQVTFDDVADVEEAKNDLREVVDFLRHPDKYHSLGARIPRGVLLVGPPGTGKTLMARAVAGEAEVPFFSISASEFVEMFVGVGASRVRDLFQKAKEVAPAIVFIDELDAVGRRRGAGVGNVNDEREQTLNQLLVEMDGFDERHEVIVLAATNRPDVLDPALLRPGRFDRQVTIGLPDRKGREDILRIHTRSLHVAPDVDLTLLARTTTGLSGADLANLTNEAALAAARKSHQEVSLADFEDALDKLLLGGARPLLLDAHDRRVVAYHEAGHALVAWLTPGSDPVHKITIIPHGRALGVTAQMPDDDHYNSSREYLLARLAVMLGGRAAEEVALDDITTGAEDDLVQATRLAKRMITRWGMGTLGPLAFQADEQQPFLGYELSQGKDYSETTAARIDENVEQLINERHAMVRRLLQQARDKLDRLVQALLHEETLDQNRLMQILGPRPLAEEVEILQRP